MGDWVEESCGDRAVDEAFERARSSFKDKKREIKKARDSLRKRQEEYEHLEQDMAEEHARIVKALREQADEAQEALAQQKRRKDDTMLELGTLRGRLTHNAKEQCEWDAAHRLQEQEDVEACMIELRKLRRLNPEVAASLARRRSGTDLLE